MADDYLPSGPLDGAVTLMASQHDPATGRWRRRRVSINEVAAFILAGQAARDAAQDAALAAEIRARGAADAAEALARSDTATALSAEVQARRTADAAEAKARGDADTAQAARAAALEAKPEEAAAFTASAKLPALTALLPVTLTLTGLVPARAGDVLRAGERVVVAPAAALPAGLNIAAAFVSADGVVSVQLTTGLTLAAGAAPIGWNITALR